MSISKLQNNIFIWDFDDTISNTCPVFEKTMNHLLKDNNMPSLTEDQIGNLRGEGLLDIFNNIFNPEVAEQKIQEFLKLTHLYDESMELNKGALDALKITKKYGIINIIISNRRPDSLLERTKTLKVFEFFDYLIGKDIDIEAKPSIQMFEIAKKQFPLLAEQNVTNLHFIGDSLSDVDFCKNIGIPTKNICLIRNKYSKSDFYPNAIKDNINIIDSFLDFENILEGFSK